MDTVIHTIIGNMIRSHFTSRVDVVRHFEKQPHGEVERIELLGPEHRLKQFLLEIRMGLGVLNDDPVLKLIEPTLKLPPNVNGKVSWILGNLIVTN